MTRITEKTVDPEIDQGKITFYAGGVQQNVIDSNGIRGDAANLNVTLSPYTVGAFTVTDDQTGTIVMRVSYNGVSIVDINNNQASEDAFLTMGSGILWSDRNQSLFKIYNDGDSGHNTALCDGGPNPVIQIGNDGIAFYGGSLVEQPTVSGALSAVIDPAAKAVLTSIIAALASAVGVNLVSDGTT